MVKEFSDYVQSLALTHPALAREVEEWRGLEKVLEWMKVNDIPAGSIDLIGQDEFEYDFLIELAGGRWLAFGVT